MINIELSDTTVLTRITLNVEAYGTLIPPPEGSPGLQVFTTRNFLVRPFSIIILTEPDTPAINRD